MQAGFRVSGCDAPRPRGRERGSALLAVLGSVAVLAAVGFATASAARNSLDRTSARTDSGAAYFLARSGIETALHEMSVRSSRRRAVPQVARVRHYAFETGTVEVAIVSENGKLNVNRANRESISALLRSIGVTANRADAAAGGVIAYRAALVNGGPRRFGPRQGRPPNRHRFSSFERRSASIQMVEELLSVPNITPGLLYGRVEAVRDASGAPHGLRRIGGLLRYLRTSGPATVDINAAPREVLLAAGLEPSQAERLIEQRSASEMQLGSPMLLAAARLGSRIPLAVHGEASGWMLVSTARLAGDRARRAVTAIATPRAAGRSLRIARWYERAI